MEQETTHTVTDESDHVQLRDRRSVMWRIFGRRAPRSEIVFGCQILLIYIVAIVALINLTRGEGPDRLWVGLLSLTVGAAIPAPSLPPLDQSH